MTRCVSGGASHPFPVEDETGAHCPEHGVTLVWHAPEEISTNGAGREGGAPGEKPRQPSGQ